MNSRTTSQLIENQLPEFVREQDPNFVAFLKAYYEYLEQYGLELFNTKIIDSSINSLTLTHDASTKINAYQGKTVVCLNGPAKGHTRKITSYDPSNNVITVDPSWLSNNIPPANTKISIKDNSNPGKLLEYRDIDNTVDQFISYFQDEFLASIPGDILADKRFILKHIKEFYQSRGTEASYRFLFRILFNEEIEFYYPKVDIFRASDAKWTTNHYMRVTTNNDTFSWVNRQIIGTISKATASVEEVTQSYLNGELVSDLLLSNISGIFQNDPVKIVYPYTPPMQSLTGSYDDLLEPYQIAEEESVYSILQDVVILNAGENYKVGDIITLSGGEVPAKAIVSSVFSQYFSGRSNPPVTSAFYESYFGPSNNSNVVNDGYSLFGYTYYGPVHIHDYEDKPLNEIYLGLNETGVDNFYTNDEISLTKGKGLGQIRTITSYNGLTKVATVYPDFINPPDETTEYVINHDKGGIKSIDVLEFGLGLNNITIQSILGQNALLSANFGPISTTAGKWLQGRNGGIAGLPTTTDSFTDSNKVLQDSYYYQDYSYDIHSNHAINDYAQTVKNLLHPAGLQLFGTVNSVSNVKNNFLTIVENIILQFDPNFFQTKIKIDSSKILLIELTGQFNIGQTNELFDSRKFLSYPPNTIFSEYYPNPNQNYWRNGLANTQINNVKDLIIGNIINNPEQKINLAPDSYVTIQNDQDVTKVGPVGQNARTIARSRFKGFPPYQTFYEVYPNPNQNYWLVNLANTQIDAFKSIPIQQYIQKPENIHSNYCVDGDVTIYDLTLTNIPTIGNLAEYSFVQGIDPLIIYNLTHNPLHYGQYNGLLQGNISERTLSLTVNALMPLTNSSTIVENLKLFSNASNGGNFYIGDSSTSSSVGYPLQSTSQLFFPYTDTEYDLNQIYVTPDNPGDILQVIYSQISTPTFNSYGLQFNPQFLEYLNANVTPVSLKNCTVLVVFNSQDVSSNQTIVQSIQSLTDNGFSIDILSGGVLSFRVTNNSQSVVISYPSATIANNTWNVATLRFKQNTLISNLNDLTNQTSVFNNYPNAPVNNSQGWFYGNPSTPYNTQAMNYFNGTIAYSIIFDRSIEDYELDLIYYQLKHSILNQRSISLP